MNFTSGQEPSGAARILIVDDLEVNRDLLARRVARLGHEYAFAESGRHALRCLSQAQFDLVLLDITMPDMDGYEALERIKADPQLVHIPVVMVTAIDDVDSVVRCLELGAEDYITKPFNPVILKARIESSLNKKRVADLNSQLLNSLSREMAIAQKIQLGFLPERIPQIPGWSVAAMCEPARQVGGDFFDAMVLPNGRLAFTVADVCDKGVGAALYMALFRSLLRVSLQQPQGELSADQLLAKAIAFTNDYIANEHGRDNMFATVFAAILCPKSGQLDYINAGHDAPLLLRRAVMKTQHLNPEGLAVGMMQGQTYRPHQLFLETGDILVAFTDGLTDALSPDDQNFGDQRVIDLLTSAKGDAESLLGTLTQALAEHTNKRLPHDDVTIFCIGTHNDAPR